MNPWKSLGGALCLSLLALMVPQRALADEWNEKAILTFSGPFELPGISLPAGTYVFKLADPDGDRHIVRVFDKAEKHVYATLMTIPDERVNPGGKPLVTFAERPAGTPEAIKAWFHPGSSIGEEFAYPKLRATQLAKANNTPVLSMPNEMAANTVKPAASVRAPHLMAMKQAPVKRVTPAGEELDVVVAQVAQAAPSPALSAAQPSTESARTHAGKLPKTASSLPTLALIGIAALFAAAGTRLWRTRVA